MALRFIPGSRLDIAEAYTYYEAQRQSLGEAFLAELDAVIERLHENPKLGGFLSAGSDGRRRLVMRRFPYMIVYLIDKEDVIVLAVFHTRRDPQRLEER